MTFESQQYIRKLLSKLLAQENGNSIAVLYCDVKVPYKNKYICYNNIKHLKVYSILILDYSEWITKLQNTLNNNSIEKCIKIFDYYKFKPHNSVSWNCDQWTIPPRK